MRTLSTKNQAETTAQATRPFYVAELGLSSPLRLSTGGAVSWDGKWWNASGFRIEALTPASCVLALPNHDRAVSSLVLGEGVKQKTARVWQLYGTGPWATEDGEALFDGVMDAVPEIGDWVRIQCQAAQLRTMFAPRIFFAPPVCNHIPPAGTVIPWGGERFVLEGR